MTDDSTFSLAEALAAQKALRDAAGAEEEVFELADVIGMVSDEIDMLKEQGKSGAEIAAMVQKATGKPVTAEDVEKYYVPTDERDVWDEDEDEDS
jgi:hypothetical protein